jgi:SAM-dependent methyltransferase
LNSALAKITKEVLFASPLRRHFFPAYRYQFTPAQLCFLCDCLEKTRYVAGSIAEIGCSAGDTTIFLNKYMESSGIVKPYAAIDTFSGFVPADVDFEVSSRGKSKSMYRGFRINNQRWFDGALKQNGITHVRTIKGDVNLIDLTALAPLSFALLDVDLYRPIAKALPELWSVLTPGGIIVVDDCNVLDTHFDGANAAYKAFMTSIQMPVEIVHGKLGILRKPQ